MKKVLIISPYFPPSNAADMQRIRMSLPYFKELGWIVEIVTVDPLFSDFQKDTLLLESIPDYITVHKVKAFSSRWTMKIGLGNIALRSLFFYKNKVNKLLKTEKYDLIYFSTTQFPICILGAYWKKKFKIPYVIDMQDPWHSDYYLDKPKKERPKKYWFSYRLNKFLEPIAMKNVDGLISVSQNYIKTLKLRYPNLANTPCQVITFGANELDFSIANKNDKHLKLYYNANNDKTNLVYVGRGGYDMRDALEILFKAFKTGLKNNPKLFGNIHFHFIGTSYAPTGKGIPTINPIAKKLNISQYVTELTDRIGFYETIKQLKSADGLLIIGSNDSSYTASKLYPYILSMKNLLAILNKKSSAAKIMTDCNAGELISFEQTTKEVYHTFYNYINDVKNKNPSKTNFSEFEPYTAYHLTKCQVQLFNEVLFT